MLTLCVVVIRQVRSDVLQFVQTTTSEVLKWRRHVKKNKIRSHSDTSEAVYPRQALVSAEDMCKRDAADHHGQSLGDDSDQLTTTMTNALHEEHQQSLTQSVWS